MGELPIVERLKVRAPACPFDSKYCNIEPTQPCPVCGDLGTFESSAPSNCKSDIHTKEEAADIIKELVAALEPFVEFADLVENKYRKRGGNPDIFPDSHPFCDIKAKELRMIVWRDARAALAKARGKK